MKVFDLPDDLCVLLLCDWLTIREWGTLLLSSSHSSCDYLLSLMKTHTCNSSTYKTSVYLEWVVKNKIRINAVALDVRFNVSKMSKLDTSRVIKVSAFGFFATKFVPQCHSITELNFRCSFIKSDLLNGFLSTTTLKRVSFVSLDADEYCRLADATAEKQVAKILRNNSNLEYVHLAKFYGKGILKALGGLSCLMELRFEHFSRVNTHTLVYLLNLFNQNENLRLLTWKSINHYIYWERGGRMDFKYTNGCPEALQNLLKALTNECSALYCEIKPLKLEVLWSLHNCTPSLDVVHYRTPGRNENLDRFANEDVLRSKFRWTLNAYCDILCASDYENASYWNEVVRMPYWYMRHDEFSDTACDNGDLCDDIELNSRYFCLFSLISD